jgi:hypothetical protein
MQHHSASIKSMKFDPGKIVATPAVIKKIADPDYALAALALHLTGNWGMLDIEDWDANNDALKHGGRLLSSYPLPDEEANFWIITDGGVTTILLPSDY